MNGNLKGQSWWATLLCWVAAFAALFYTAETGSEVYGALFVICIFGTLATIGIRFARD